MIDDSKFNDNIKPPKNRKPFQFDKELKQAAEETKRVIIEEEKESDENGNNKE
jgi:hypothetical protein